MGLLCGVLVCYCVGFVWCGVCVCVVCGLYWFWGVGLRFRGFLLHLFGVCFCSFGALFYADLVASGGVVLV